MFKFKLMLAGIVLMGFGILGFIQSNEAPFMIFFLLGALLCSGIVLFQVHKVKRDQQIIAQAQQAREIAINAPSTLPPITSEGSRRLFVPPPLK